MVLHNIISNKILILLTYILDEFAEHVRSDGCELRWLAHHSVATDQCWCQFEGEQVEWQVPRTNETNNTDGGPGRVVQNSSIGEKL